MRELAAEIILIAAALPLYYLVRGFSHERVELAFDHADQLIDLEKTLGIFWEADLQELVLPYGLLVDSLNSIYLYGHQPVILAVAVWLFFWHRPQYLFMRNAFLISGAIGLIVYASYPVAPPRFMMEFGFEDTILDQYGVSRVANPWFFRNEYAAVPSLHFGWNLLAGVAMWLASRNPAVRALAVFVPLATLAAVILTANHYFLDAVAGALTVAAGAAIALAVRNLVLRYRPPGPGAVTRAWGWVSWLGGMPTFAPGAARLGPDGPLSLVRLPLCCPLGMPQSEDGGVAMYKRILVTLDGSPLSEEVLPQVERLVAGTYTSVTLLRVAELPEQTVARRVPTPMPAMIVGSCPTLTQKTEPQLAETRGQAIRRVKEEAEAYLNEKARPLRAKGIEVESARRLGHPAEEIIHYARTHDVDLIMMSTHGRSGLGRMFFGSVAGRVLLSGVKPILLVRPDGLE